MNKFIIIEQFFMWMTIINIGLLLFLAVVFMFFSDQIYKIHSKIVNMKRDTFNVIIYCLLGLYKLLIFVFIVIPYIVMLIMR